MPFDLSRVGDIIHTWEKRITTMIILRMKESRRSSRRSRKRNIRNLVSQEVLTGHRPLREQLLGGPVDTGVNKELK